MRKTYPCPSTFLQYFLESFQPWFHQVVFMRSLCFCSRLEKNLAVPASLSCERNIPLCVNFMSNINCSNPCWKIWQKKMDIAMCGCFCSYDSPGFISFMVVHNLCIRVCQGLRVNFLWLFWRRISTALHSWIFMLEGIMWTNHSKDLKYFSRLWDILLAPVF